MRQSFLKAVPSAGSFPEMDTGVILQCQSQVMDRQTDDMMSLCCKEGFSLHMFALCKLLCRDLKVGLDVWDFFSNLTKLGSQGRYGDARGRVLLCVPRSLFIKDTGCRSATCHGTCHMHTVKTFYNYYCHNSYDFILGNMAWDSSTGHSLMFENRDRVGSQTCWVPHHCVP